MADLNREALIEVKSSLNIFQNEVDNISRISLNHAHTIIEERYLLLKKSEREIEQTRIKVNQLKSKLITLKSKLYHLHNISEKIKSEILLLESKIKNIEYQITKLENEYKNEQESNLGILSHISELKHQREEVQNRINSLFSEERKLKEEINYYSIQIRCNTTELTDTEKKLKFQNDRLMRLTTAFYKLQQRTENYISLLQRFNDQSQGLAQSNLSAVSNCINNIDLYLSVNFK